MSRPLEAFLAALAGCGRCLLGLDYDGTLAPFRRRRGNAVPYPGVRELLRGIMAGGRTRVVILSGRPVSEVQDLLAMEPAPEIWGSHGWERRLPEGAVEIMPGTEDERAVLAAARRRLAEHGLLGCAEWKTAGVAVHWRGAADAEDLQAQALAALLPLAAAPEFEIMPIAAGLELRCRRWHKGTALATVLAEEAPGVGAAYLGDDATDEDAFAVLAGRGLAVRVGTGPLATTATAVLEPGPGVLEFLGRWLAAAGDPGVTAAARRAT